MPHIEVWYDKTSDYDNPVWIVSLENGGSNTLSIHKTKKAALKRARSEARKRGLQVKSNPRRRKRANGKRRARKLMASGGKKLAAWVRSQANRKRRKNPVRVGATVVGKGTGWIKSKATRVVKKGGRYVVEVKR